MDNRELVKELKALCQLDIDAIHAYDQAHKNVDIPEIKSRIGRFRTDHERHVNELTTLINGLGEKSPEFSTDFKGFFLKAFTAIRSVTGTEGALKALKGGEEMTNKEYSRAVKLDFPPAIKPLIEKAYADEQLHLNYIVDAINTRAWEKAA